MTRILSPVEVIHISSLNTHLSQVWTSSGLKRDTIYHDRQEIMTMHYI